MNHAYNWKEVIEKYMLKGDEPLINGLIGGRTQQNHRNPPALTAFH
jgi:hypothetical protein